MENTKVNTNVDINGKKYSKVGFIMVILIATFAGMLMQTSLGTAIPTLMKDFNINLATAQNATSWFLLANGIMIPVSAYLATRFKTKWLFITAYILLFLGTLAVYTAPTDNWNWFIAGRIITAIAVGISMPLMQVALVYMFPAEKRGTAMGLAGLVVGMAPAIGPTLSGWILDKSHKIFGFTLPDSWRSIFLIPLVIIGITLVFSFFFLKNIIPNKKIKLDFRSLVQSLIGFGLLLWALSNVSVASYDGWADIPHVIVPGLIGIFFIVLFNWHQLTMKTPFLDVRVFKNKQFTVTTILVSLVMMAMMGVEMMLPTYLQQIRGLSPLDSGLMLLPGAVLMGLMSPIAGRIYDRVGVKRLVFAGFLTLAAATIPFMLINENTPHLFITVMYTVRMFGVSILMMPLTAASLSSLPSDEATHGTAVNNTTRQVAAAVIVSLLTSVTQNIINSNSPAKSLKTENVIKFGKETMNAAIDGFRAAFAIAAVIAVIGLIVAFFLKNGKTVTKKEEEII